MILTNNPNRKVLRTAYPLAPVATKKEAQKTWASFLLVSSGFASQFKPKPEIHQLTNAGW